MQKTNEIAKTTEEINLANPSEIMEFANNLKSLIVENKLYTDIKGKNYVNVEGWQIAGAFTGVFPIVESVENLSTDNLYKYRAEVSLRDKDNNKVGYGVAICTNKESGKTSFDEYAVASMAQTRAVGKAFRMKIGWLLKIAGYETTPAEEMVEDAIEGEVVKPKAKAPIVEEPQKPKYSVRDISYAKDRMDRAENIGELKTIFVALGDVRNAPEVVAYKDELKAKLESKNE